MKITHVSCTQFAGVRGLDIALGDGINVVYGKNESGKSTLVNLISRTLFQDAKLDRRTDREFHDTFFPAPKRGAAYSSDFIDGRLTFETEKGVYVLSKEWSAEPQIRLSTPDGVMRDASAVSALLKEALVYGEGVYADMLLSSQRNTDAALRSLLGVSGKEDMRQEISEAVTRAFAASDGLSPDVIGQAIDAKIEEIEGKHWDETRNAPVRKAGRWQVGLGEILKAYYALEDANAVLQNIAEFEVAVDRANAEYARRDAETRTAEEAYERFGKCASKLSLLRERMKSADRVRAELNRTESALADWPALKETVKRAKALEKELGDRMILDLYASAKARYEELVALQQKAEKMCCPEEREIAEVRIMQRSVIALENKLCGMNLNADIDMIGGHHVRIESLRTGEVAEDPAHISLSEAVRITVPGVMEMRLSPANVDVADVERQLTEKRASISSILQKYGVEDAEALEKTAREYINLQTSIGDAAAKLNASVNGRFEDVERAARAISDTPRTKEEISAEILRLTGMQDVSRFIIMKETSLQAYENEYADIAALEDKVLTLRKEAQAIASQTADSGIPAEFAAVTDPEAHLAALQDAMKTKQRLREEALTAKTSAESKLETFRKDHAGDLRADAERAQNAFEEQKALLAHWKHIAAVFAREKAAVRDHPLEDLAANFSRYLSVITDGKVTSEFPEADKLDMSIYSADRSVDYSKLSEGTKETVSLAFRLAVLDHLFPEGGGLVVLDDPFANMDADRTAKSVQLVKDCAARHQVIFLTCKEEYLPALGGSVIRL